MSEQAITTIEQEACRRGMLPAEVALAHILLALLRIERLLERVTTPPDEVGIEQERPVVIAPDEPDPPRTARRKRGT